MVDRLYCADAEIQIAFGHTKAMQKLYRVNE